jgi:hypothetical protein
MGLALQADTRSAAEEWTGSWVAVTGFSTPVHGDVACSR